MAETTQVSFWLDADLIKEFKKFCIDRGVTMSKQIEEIIAHHLNNEEAVTNENHGHQ